MATCAKVRRLPDQKLCTIILEVQSKACNKANVCLVFSFFRLWHFVCRCARHNSYWWIQTWFLDCPARFNNGVCRNRLSLHLLYGQNR